MSSWGVGAVRVALAPGLAGRQSGGAFRCRSGRTARKLSDQQLADVTAALVKGRGRAALSARRNHFTNRAGGFSGKVAANGVDAIADHGRR